MSVMIPNDTAAGHTITCGVTSWYFKRMGMMAGMFILMGAYFCYDGTWGYPKANVIAEKKAWYEQEVLAAYDVEKAKGEEAAEAWMKQAREKGWVIKAGLKEPRWDDYAAPHGWAAKPKLYSHDEIIQQFQWGGGMFFGALVTGVLVLLSRNKTLVGRAEDMIMPNGKTVRYTDTFKVDKRKWDNKGLAYVYYREREGSPERKAVVDDLKFDGAGRVLDRLLAQFSGELIEKIQDPMDEEEAAAEANAVEDATEADPQARN